MEYAAILLLTIGLTLYILYRGKQTKIFPRIIHSQSSIHSLIKDFLPKDLYKKPNVISQSIKHIEKNSIKVIFLEGSAYWIKDNIFYCADAIDNNVNIDTTRQVDTNNMSKRDIDKMLFILDNLRGDKGNDSSSTRY